MYLPIVANIMVVLPEPRKPDTTIMSIEYDSLAITGSVAIRWGIYKSRAILARGPRTEVDGHPEQFDGLEQIYDH